MLTKVAIFLAVVVGVFVVARMGAASAFRPASKRRRKSVRSDQPEDLAPCPACGAFGVASDPCPCGGVRKD